MADKGQDFGCLFFILKDVVLTVIFLYLWLVKDVPFWSLVAWWFALNIVAGAIVLVVKVIRCRSKSNGDR